jgi:hypothetical protein
MKLADFVEKLNRAVKTGPDLLELDVFIEANIGDRNMIFDVEYLVVRMETDVRRKTGPVVVLSI